MYYHAPTLPRAYLREGLVLVALKLRHDLLVRRDADELAKARVVLQELQRVLPLHLPVRSAFSFSTLLVALLWSHGRRLDYSAAVVVAYLI